MNFKVKCVGYNASERNFTIGKVYDVKDGHIFSDGNFDYDAWSIKGKTFDSLCKWFNRWYKFELVKDEPKCKFKVGDKIRANRLSDEAYLTTSFKEKWVGEVVEIGQFSYTCGLRDDIKVKGKDGRTFSVHSKYFDLIEESSPELHITVKGNETIAVYKNGTEYKKAVAKCSPEDTFDFGIGAKLAHERLGVLPTTEPVEPVVEDKPLKLSRNGCCYGTVGEPTGYKDVYGKSLVVGDVVSVWAKDTQMDYGEGVVVNKHGFFVSGMRSACNDEKWTIDPDWVITKVKDHSEMKRGDHVDGIDYVD